MLVSALVLSSMLGQDKPVALSRVFAKGEKSQYEVQSSLQVESRQRGLETWMPEDLDIQYKFTAHVFEMGADGIAKVKYLRPTMTEIQGETYNSAPKTKVEKVNYDLLLTLSPINEILDMKDEAKKPAPKKKGGWVVARATPVQDFIGRFISEIYRMSLFIGTLDSSMDFAPRLPFDEVKVGDTWKRTISYQPQKLKGKEGKQQVQRLDYTFTFKGLTQSQGKQVYRVTADTSLDTDIGAFFNQI